MAQYNVSTAQSPKEIRWKEHGKDLLLGATLLGTNGTTGFGSVEGGTILGRITASGKVRPCAKQSISNTGSSNTPQMGSAKNFFVGDTVRVIAGTGALGTASLNADGAGNNIDITGKAYDGRAHTLQLANPGAPNQALSVGVTVNPSTLVATIVANLATGPNSRQMNASGSGTPARIDLTGRDAFDHVVEILGSTGNDVSLSVAVVVAESGVATITVTPATNGGGTITSTVTQVINALNGSDAADYIFAELGNGNGADTVIAVASGALGGEAITSTLNQVIAALNGSDAFEFITASLGSGDSGVAVCIAVAATPLAGGVAAGATKANARAVTAVDKASSPNTVTFDGAAVTLAAGDYIEVYDGSETPVGILETGVSTLDLQTTKATGSVAYMDVEVAFGVHGMFKTDQLVGLDALITTALGATNDGVRYFL